MSYVFEIELVATKSDNQRFVSTIRSIGYDITRLYIDWISTRYQICPKIEDALEANARAREISEKIRSAAHGLDIIALEQRVLPSPEMKAKEKIFLQRMQH